jgi:hypothetical protein
MFKCLFKTLIGDYKLKIKKMNKISCKCIHHWIPTIMMVLIWLMGISFFSAVLKNGTLFGLESSFYAWSVVVLAVMGWYCDFCGCCCNGKSCGNCYVCKSENNDDDNMCAHESGCKCGDCEKCH